MACCVPDCRSFFVESPVDGTNAHNRLLQVANVEYLSVEREGRSTPLYNGIERKLVRYRSELHFRDADSCFLDNVKAAQCSVDRKYAQAEDHEFMQVEDFIYVIHVCEEKKNLQLAKRVYDRICDCGLDGEQLLGNHVVVLLLECGGLSSAQQIFNRLTCPNVFSWTSLMIGYIDHGQAQHVFTLIDKMLEASVPPNNYTFVALLKACARLKCVERGQELHYEIAKEGLEQNVFVGSTLVDMYMKCSLLDEACEVFDQLSAKTVVSWTALIEGFTEHGCFDEVLRCLECMRMEQISPDAISILCSLKACSSNRVLDKGRELHTEIIFKGFENFISVGNTLIDMYARCGFLDEAQEVFETLPNKDVVSWNVLITGYVNHGLCEEALSSFSKLQSKGISPNDTTFICSLQACRILRVMDMGRQIHFEATRSGLESKSIVGTALVDMYLKCGALLDAQDVFDKLQTRDVILWTTLIAGYADYGYLGEALKGLEIMKLEGILPNRVTFLCCLKACSSILSSGKELHSEIAKEGFEEDLAIGNALVDMYAKSGSLENAVAVFDELPVRDVITWNSLMSGFAEHGFYEKASDLFTRMQSENISPDTVTLNTLILAFSELEEIDTVLKLYVQILQQGLLMDSITIANVLRACANVTKLEIGKRLHIQVVAQGLQNAEVFLATAFIDMYSKCGCMLDAQRLFDEMLTRDLVAWNALMTGYSQQGASERVFDLFERMTVEDMLPNDVTCLNIIAVCNHVGIVEMGQRFLINFSEDHGIFLNIKHRNCLADLLGRAGQLGKSLSMLEKMAFQANISSWTILLAACQKWGNLELGKYAFQHAILLDREYFGTFITISNVYADVKTSGGGFSSRSRPTKYWMQLDETKYHFLAEYHNYS